MAESTASPGSKSRRMGCIPRCCAWSFSTAVAVAVALTAWLLNQAKPAHPVPREGLRPLAPLKFPNPRRAQVINIVYLHRTPDGIPSEDDYGMASIPVPDLEPGHILVKTKWLSVDPYMRHRMGGGGNLLPNVTTNDSKAIEMILNRSPVSENIGVVTASRVDKFPVGALVRGFWSWADGAVLKPADQRVRHLRPIHEPQTTALGTIGMTGRTAYKGLHKVLKPKLGEVLFVTGAAGATGAAVGQLAKAAGLRVFGSAGSDAKVQYLMKLGFDGAFNYRKEDPYAALERLTPDGIDLFFENTGGPVSEAVLHRLRDGARIAVCGTIHWYNIGSDTRTTIRLASLVRAFLPTSFRAAVMGSTAPSTWMRSWAFKVLAHQHLPKALGEAGGCKNKVHQAPATVGINFTYEGFLVSCNNEVGEEDKVEDRLAQLVREGKLNVTEDILAGTVADIPRAFIRMMAGHNHGKQLVELAQHA